MMSIDVYASSGPPPGELVFSRGVIFRKCETYFFLSEGTSVSHSFTYEGTPDPSTGGMTLTEFQTTKTESLATTAQTLYEARVTLEEAATIRNNAKAQAEASITQAVPTLGGPVTVVSSPNGLSADYPVIGTIDLNPANYEPVAQYISWIKSAITWSILVAWVWWAWREFAVLMAQAGAAQQAKGNTVAGTGGQITGLIAAGIILALIVAVPAVYWALVSMDLSPLGSNPFSSPSGGVSTGLYLVGLFIPYDLVIYLMATSFIVVKAKIVILVGVQTAVRFVVP